MKIYIIVSSIIEIIMKELPFQDSTRQFLNRFYNQNQPIEVLLLSLLGLILILLSTTMPYASYTTNRDRDIIVGLNSVTWEPFLPGLVMLSLIVVIALIRYYELATLLTRNEKWINAFLDILALALLFMGFLYFVIELYNVGLQRVAMIQTQGFYIDFLGGTMSLIYGLFMLALSILINITQKRFLNVATFIVGFYIFSWLYLWIIYKVWGQIYYIIV